MAVQMQAMPPRVRRSAPRGRAPEALASLASRIATREGTGKFIAGCVAAFDFSRSGILPLDPVLTTGLHYDSSRKGLVVDKAYFVNPGFEDPTPLAGWTVSGPWARTAGGPEGGYYASIGGYGPPPGSITSSTVFLGSSIRLWVKHYWLLKEPTTVLLRVRDPAGNLLKEISLKPLSNNVWTQKTCDCSDIAGLEAKVEICWSGGWAGYPSSLSVDFVENLNPPTEFEGVAISEEVPSAIVPASCFLWADYRLPVSFFFSADGGLSWTGLRHGQFVGMASGSGQRVRLKAIVGVGGVLRAIGVAWRR